jgi:succinylarginine dihydrolase
VEIFVYGKKAFGKGDIAPKNYPARQTLEASQAIARLHGLSDENLVYIQQNPEVIDQGVFHNDVISVGNQNVLFYHEQAFLDKDKKLAEIKSKFSGEELYFIKVPDAEVSVSEAVKTYLFNTQILTLPEGHMTIIAPTECQESKSVSNYLSKLVEQDTPIKQVNYFDVKQSMRNGGGPACLRLRVALTDDEINAVNPNTLLTDDLFKRLNKWVDKHYRDELTENDLADPGLLVESRTALDELTQIMKLGSVYTFQRD